MDQPNPSELARRFLQQQRDLGVNEVILEPSSGASVDEAGPGLDELYAATCECRNCGLGATRTKFVFGSGNPDADLMFIGEAPGRDEDLQGLPFVGRAGQLLTKMIEAMGLSRDQVYIGNILKCRPPNNRDPLPDEMAACFPILKQQIQAIRPRYVCALGRIAAQALLQTTTALGKLRGTFHNFEGTKLVVTYHPAALLRNPSWKRPAWEDLQMIMKDMGLKNG